MRMLGLAVLERAGSAAPFAVAAAYVLGSVPFGLLLGRAVAGVDIRRVGSGNIGATNVGRALGRPWALVAFGFDFAKGWVATALLGPWLAGDGALGWTVLCGAAAVCGHCWSVFLGFRGGKGVATGCGALVGLDPWLFLGGGAVWLVTLALFRYVSLASLAMGLAFPLLALWRARQGVLGREVVFGASLLTVLVFVRHRGNMVRMWSGTEPKVGRRRPVERDVRRETE